MRYLYLLILQDAETTIYRNELRRGEAAMRRQGPGAVFLHGLLDAVGGHRGWVRVGERRRCHRPGRRRPSPRGETVK